VNCSGGASFGKGRILKLGDLPVCPAQLRQRGFLAPGILDASLHFILNLSKYGPED